MFRIMICQKNLIGPLKRINSINELQHFLTLLGSISIEINLVQDKILECEDNWQKKIKDDNMGQN